jgi:hypothetical protein
MASYQAFVIRPKRSEASRKALSFRPERSQASHKALSFRPERSEASEVEEPAFACSPTAASAFR